MPTTISFNTELFDKWDNEDRLVHPWSNQITLRCLILFDTKIRAMNARNPNKEAWSEKFKFTLNNLSEMNEENAYIVTPCGLYLIEKSRLSNMLTGSEAWLFFVKTLKQLNVSFEIVGHQKRKIPKKSFITRIITLQARDDERYLLLEQYCEIHTDKAKFLDTHNQWYDIDLGRFEP